MGSAQMGYRQIKGERESPTPIEKGCTSGTVMAAKAESSPKGRAARAGIQTRTRQLAIQQFQQKNSFTVQYCNTIPLCCPPLVK
jgi:hypothetical protein